MRWGREREQGRGVGGMGKRGGEQVRKRDHKSSRSTRPASENSLLTRATADRGSSSSVLCLQAV